MKTLYFHGLPGSAAELGLTRLSGLTTPDRNLPDFDALARSLPAGELHLFGFSLGAATALQMAARLPDRVVRVTLASPVAPLELGDFLPQMAGASVFRAAQTPGKLAKTANVQTTLIKTLPSLAINRMLAGVSAREKAFFQDKSNRKCLTQSVRDGLTTNRDAYLTEITRYVQPWASVLGQVRCQVAIFHGTEDTWSPPKMATALAQKLRYAEVSWMEGRGHYTTLAETADALARLPELR